MKDRHEIFGIYIDDFGAYKKAKVFNNPNFVVTDDFINDSIEKTENRFKNLIGEQIILSPNEKNEVIKKIKSIYSV